jgi:hypothetical protein
MAQTDNGMLLKNAQGQCWTVIPLETGARVVPGNADRPAFELSPRDLAFFIAINNLDVISPLQPPPRLAGR